MRPKSYRAQSPPDPLRRRCAICRWAIDFFGYLPGSRTYTGLYCCYDVESVNPDVKVFNANDDNLNDRVDECGDCDEFKSREEE